MFSTETMQIDQGSCYHCCSKCRGLFSSGDDHLKHSVDCNGNPFKSTSLHFACERKIYLQFFQSEDFQSDGTLNQLTFSKDDSFLDHVVKIKMPQDVFDPSIFLRNNASTSLQAPAQDTGFVLESGTLSTEENKSDEDYLAGKKPRFSECIEQDQLRKIINKNIDYLKSDDISALSSQTNKDLHFSSSRSESRLLSPIDKHFLSDLPKSRVQSPFEKCMNYLQDTGAAYQTGSVNYASNQSIPFSCNLTTDLLGGLASTCEENMTSVDDLPTLQYLDLAKKDIFLGQNPGLNQMNSKDPFLINATVKPERPMSSGPRIQTQSSKSCEDLQNSPTFPLQPLQDGNYFSFPSTLDEPTQLDYLDLATLDFLTNPSSFGVYGTGATRDRFLSDREDIYSECNFLFHDHDNIFAENVLKSEKTSLDDNVKFNKGKMKRIILKKVKRGIEKKKKQSPARKKSSDSREETELAQNLQFEALTDSLQGRSGSNKKTFKRTYSAEYEQIKSSLYTRKRKLMSSSETLSFRISPDAKRKAKVERKFNESQRLCSSNTILNVKDSLVGYSEEEKKSMTGVFGQMGCFIVKKNKYGSKSCSAVDQIITEVSSVPGEGKLVVLEGTSLKKCDNLGLTIGQSSSNGSSENVKSVLKLKCQYCPYNTTSVADFKEHKFVHEQSIDTVEKLDDGHDMVNTHRLETEFTATPVSRVECKKVLSAYEIHRHLEPSCTQPKVPTMDKVASYNRTDHIGSPDEAVNNTDITQDYTTDQNENSHSQNGASAESLTYKNSLLELCGTGVAEYTNNTISMESLIECSNSKSGSDTREMNIENEISGTAYDPSDDFVNVAVFSVSAMTQNDNENVPEYKSPDISMIPDQESTTSHTIFDESDKTDSVVSPSLSSENSPVKSDRCALSYTSDDTAFTEHETIATPSFGDNFTMVYEANNDQPSNDRELDTCDSYFVQTNFSDNVFPPIPAQVTLGKSVGTDNACSTVDTLDESQIATSVLSQEILPRMISEAQDTSSQDTWTNLVTKPVETSLLHETVIGMVHMENNQEESTPVKMRDDHDQNGSIDLSINTQSCINVVQNLPPCHDVINEKTVVSQPHADLCSNYPKTKTIDTVPILDSSIHSVPMDSSDLTYSSPCESLLHNQTSFTVLHGSNKLSDDQRTVLDKETDNRSDTRGTTVSYDIDKADTKVSTYCDGKMQETICQQQIPVLGYRSAGTQGLVIDKTNTSNTGSKTNENVNEMIEFDRLIQHTEKSNVASVMIEETICSKKFMDKETTNTEETTMNCNNHKNKNNVSRNECKKVLSAYEFHRHLEPSCTPTTICEVNENDESKVEPLTNQKHVADVGVQCNDDSDDEAGDIDGYPEDSETVEEISKPTEVMLSTPAGIVRVDHCYGQNLVQEGDRSPHNTGQEDQKICSFSEADESTFECGHCDFNTTNKQVMKNHVVKHKGVYLYCSVPECDFKTVYKRCLNAHLLKHNSEHMLLCDQCTFTTTDGNSLKRHIQDMHYYMNRFKCPECDHMSMFRDRIAKHYRNTHLQEKVYACNQCDYRTGYTHLLKFHLMAHAGIRPYKCSACDYQVNNINKVNRHIKTRHKEEHGIWCEKLDLDFEVDARQFQCETKTCDKDINIIEMTEEQSKELSKKNEKKSRRNKYIEAQKEKEKTVPNIPRFNPKIHQPKKMVSLLSDKTKPLGNLNTQSQTTQLAHSVSSTLARSQNDVKNVVLTSGQRRADSLLLGSSSYQLPRINIVQLPQDQYKIVNRNCNVVVNRRSIDDIYVPVRNKVDYTSSEEISNSKLIRKNVSVESLIHDQGETSYGDRHLETEYQCTMCDFKLKSHDDIAQHLLVCDMEKE